MFQDILNEVFEMEQDIIETCISIIRENDDMLRSFFIYFAGESVHLQEMVPIPFTNVRDFCSTGVDSSITWIFDATLAVGHRKNKAVIWPHYYDVEFDYSHLYTGEVPRPQRGSRFPWFHCNCLTDALFTLSYDSPPMAVLSILLLPGMDDFEIAYKFSDYLKAVKERLTLFFIAPNLACEDLGRVKPFLLINKCKNPNVTLCFDWRFIPYKYCTVEKDENGHFKMLSVHRIPKPIHHMHFDKYCSF